MSILHKLKVPQGPSRREGYITASEFEILCQELGLENMKEKVYVSNFDSEEDKFVIKRRGQYIYRSDWDERLLHYVAECIQLRQKVIELQQKTIELQQTIDHAPGGIIYEAAKRSFEHGCDLQQNS
jgi:hypothetical protein